MSLTVMPNSGIFNDDNLDRLRSEAIIDCQDGLPEPLVYYLRALEGTVLDMRAQQKKMALRDIAWKFKEAANP